MKTKLELNINNIQEEHQNVLDSPDYGNDYKLIYEILNKYPKNTEKEIVALKIYLINTTNSTNLRRYKQKIHISELADIITKIKNFDKRVEDGDPGLVEELAKGNGTVKLFSFASKYCCHHNSIVYAKDDYYIFDTVLKNNLHKYFEELTPNLLEQYRTQLNYKSYKDSLDKCLEEHNLLGYASIRRRFDHFVWNQFRPKSKEEENHV